MNTRSILEDVSEEMGWDLESQLTLCLRYISNQDANDAFEDFLRQAADAERHAEGKLIEGDLSVPESWEDLISHVFGVIEDVSSGTYRTDITDPEPYYDDLRRVRTALDPVEEDWVAEMELCSGQSNYWATIHIVDNSNGELVAQSEPYHEPMDEARFVVDGIEYVVNVHFDK
jgi:hypothetical protein